jgi:hypothetical protein
MQLNRTLRNIFVIASMGLVISACGDNNDHVAGNKDQVFYGAEVNVGNGKIRSFVKKDSSGKPSVVGLAISEETLNSLPESGGAFTIPMPEDNGTLFRHIAFEYSPHHQNAVYDTPHVTAHFYMIPEEERKAIRAEGQEMEVLPATAFVPKDYIPTEGGAAQIGKHWIDTTGEELNGKPFKRAVAYGSYNGKLVSVESMINLAFLQSKKTTGWPVKDPEAVQAAGFYATSYSIGFDQSEQLYTMTLESLKYKNN